MTSCLGWLPCEVAVAFAPGASITMPFLFWFDIPDIDQRLYTTGEPTSQAPCQPSSSSKHQPLLIWPSNDNSDP